MTARLRAIALGVAALAVTLAGPAHAALDITNVSHAPAAIDSTKGQSVDVRFRLSEPARVTLRIFDGRDLMVREVRSAKVLAAGDQRLSWDGRDTKGRPVPPEAYVYTLTATPGSGAPVEYDLTDLSENGEIAPPTVRWDPAKHLVRYDLAAPARLKIRAGLANGPLLKTVIDGVARAAGPHAEPWDGKDESGLIDAAANPDLQLSVQAWLLPRNAIVVLPERPKVELIARLDGSEVRRAKKREPQPSERALDQQPIGARGDVQIRLSIPDGNAHDPNAVSVAAGKVAVQLDVDPDDRARLLEQRFEVGFFLDGKYMFENEVGFLPMTWVWDAGGVNEGIHYVTGNVWGYAGQFGAATIAVRVAPK